MRNYHANIESSDIWIPETSNGAVGHAHSNDGEVGQDGSSNWVSPATAALENLQSVGFPYDLNSTVDFGFHLQQYESTLQPNWTYANQGTWNGQPAKSTQSSSEYCQALQSHVNKAYPVENTVQDDLLPGSWTSFPALTEFTPDKQSSEVSSTELGHWKEQNWEQDWLQGASPLVVEHDTPPTVNDQSDPKGLCPEDAAPQVCFGAV